MRARVIAVAMQKGGVGKTTTVINLGYEFASAGLRVLVVDLDQQAHATGGLGVAVSGDDASMYEVLHPDRAERVRLCEVIKRSPEFGVDVAPAAYALRSLERTGLGSGGQMRLARELDALDDYEVVLIDCPPALGDLTVAALAAADDVLATVSPGPDEVEALRVLGNTVLDVQESLNPRLDIRHVLTTNFDGRPQLAKDVRRGLATDWPQEYLGEISSTIRVGEAKARQLPVAVHAPECTAAEDYRRVARELGERMIVHAT